MNAFNQFLQVVNAKGIEFHRRLELPPILAKLSPTERDEAESILIKKFNGFDQIIIDGLAFLNTERTIQALEEAFSKSKDNETNLAKYCLSKALFISTCNEKYLNVLLNVRPNENTISDIDRTVYVGMFSSFPRRKQILIHLLDFIKSDLDSSVRFNALRSFFIIIGYLKEEDNSIPQDLRNAFFAPIINNVPNANNHVIVELEKKI